MKIALDLDGVLADMNETMVERTEYTYSDFHTFAEWDDFEKFYSDAREVWNTYWQEINPVEDNLAEKVQLLSTYHDVDIVTNTAADDRYAKVWLQKQGIEYDNFVRPHEDGYKDALDYDLYIDDNPHLCGDVPVQYVVDQPWNQTERGSGPYLYHSYEESYIESEGTPDKNRFLTDAPWVIRVNGLVDVIYDLENRNL